MARVLLGWELGANRGHLIRLIPVAEKLAEQGHSIAVALQRIDGIGRAISGVSVWQAPIWPRLLANTGRAGGAPVATMGDILARIGLDMPGTLAAMIAGWDAVLAAVDPDLVIADYAPALLCAARGRRTLLGIGSGFERVPAHLDCFPSLTGLPAVDNEEALVARINDDLATAARDPIDRYPALFQTDASVTGTFAELDPYRADRREPLAAPSVALPLPPPGTGGGDEVFVYASETVAPDAALWAGLGRAGLPVRVHVANAPRPLADAICAAGLFFEPRPLPFAQIAERSRLLVSNGGAGFVSSALIAGLPQVVVHQDLEKALNGRAVMETRLGGQVALHAIEPDAFAASLGALYHDENMAARARAAAPGFRDRATPCFEAAVVDAALAMIA